MKTLKDTGDKCTSARKSLARSASMDTQSDELFRKKAINENQKKAIEESVRMGEYEADASKKEQAHHDGQPALGSEFWFG